MSRTQKLALWTFAVTLLLVAIGGFTRGSGSGYGCLDRWPLCENGLLGGLLPRPEFHMVVEWTHRWFAAIAGVLTLATTIHVWRRWKGERGLRVGAIVALVAIVIQAGLGAVVVMTDLDADLVSVHLGTAMVVLALLTFVSVESFFAGGARPVASRTPDRAWRRLLWLGAAATYLTIMFGSFVHNRYVPGWPLVHGQVVPEFPNRTVELHFGHRVTAGLATLFLAWLAAQVIRRGRPGIETRLVHTALAAFLVNVGLGAAHVFTEVDSTGLVVAHILVASIAWSALIAAATVARRADRAGQPADRQPPVTEPAGAPA